MHSDPARNKTLKTVGYGALFLLLLALKLYKLPQAGLPDYDSVKCFQVATEMAQGNFTNLYRHASPTFNLFLAAQLKLFDNYVWSEYLNSFIILLASFIFSRFVSRELKLKTSEDLLLFAFLGSSPTLTWLGRSLTFDGLSFLLYVLFLKHFYYSLFSGNKKELYLAALFYGLMFTVDYKVLLLLPIIILIQLYLPNRNYNLKTWLNCGLVLFLIFSLFALVGVLVGQPWYKYYLVAGIIPFKENDHPNRVVGFFNLDLLYYFKYLFFFENPLLLIGLLALPQVSKFRELLKNREMNLVIYLAIFGFCLLAGMSLIQKAPRGLLYAYPVLYAIAFVAFKQLVQQKGTFPALIFSGIAFNIYTIQKQIYQYTETNYPAIATYLRERQVSKIAVTISNRIVPFLPPGITVTEVSSNQQLQNLKAEGYQYLLIDDYYKLTGIDLDLKAYQKFELEKPEPSLLSPILGLEHCEFAGFSFEEAMQINEELKAQKSHLKLVKL